VNPSNLTVFRVCCELYWSAARTRHVKPLTPHLCFLLDIPSVLFHVMDLKLSNRDPRASLQRAWNVVRNLCRLLCPERTRSRKPAPSFQTALRIRSISNEREVYRRCSEHQRQFEANKTRREHLSRYILRFRLLKSPVSDVMSFRSTQQPVHHAITSATKTRRRPRVSVYIRGARYVPERNLPNSTATPVKYAKWRINSHGVS